VKIGQCDFPEPLLTALRDNRLVVFAGAGVSRGAPANLPDFARLAELIADGTGEVRSDSEREDSFLGRLQDSGPKVHSIARDLLHGDGTAAPTTLHRDLLRLFSSAEQVRIVTTNYDPLFEHAAPDVYGGAVPECFRAPALPLGRSFSGIVHVHGDLTHPDEMVLTDADFGRAYLVEGWARRFLVDLFRHFTVFFVGYSHNDLIVSYLARALPAGHAKQRFALVGADDDLQRWSILGIEPVVYEQPSSRDHSALYEGVACLSDWVRRSIFDWQHDVSAIATKPPPEIGDAVAIIEYALKDVSTTRFFAAAARLPDWLSWLDRRGHLDGLFVEGGRLSERDHCLARWLGRYFAARFPDQVLALISAHKSRVHPDFWMELGFGFVRAEGASMPPRAWSRWISVLLTTSSAKPNGDVLMALGDRCIRDDALEDLLRVFDHMAKSHLQMDNEWHDEGFWVSELWDRGLQPKLALVAEPLLRQVIARLEEYHAVRRLQIPPECALDLMDLPPPDTEAIEHDGSSSGVFHVLVNAARGCLHWLASNRPVVAAGWCDQLARSEAPLLRRLSIFTLAARADLAADQKLDWLLAHVQLREAAECPETLSTVRSIYPASSKAKRAELIAAVLACRSPDVGEPREDQISVDERFDWLDALQSADGTCALASKELDHLRARYPGMTRNESTGWWYRIGSVVAGWRSSWQADELLSRPAADWLPQLLEVEGTRSLGPDRFGLGRAVGDAAKTDFGWSVDLAKAMAGAGEWATDLWVALGRGWRERNLDEDEFRKLSVLLARTELYREHLRVVADVIYLLVINEGKPYASHFLSQANEVATALWRHLDRDEQLDTDAAGYLQLAQQRAEGVLVEFLVGSLRIWRQHHEVMPATLNEDYRRALSAIVDDQTLPGRLGRAVLASRVALLMDADEEWTRERMLPCFDAADRRELQAVWDGFLASCWPDPVLAISMDKALLGAVGRINSDLAPLRERFVEYFVAILVSAAPVPVKEWVACLLRQGGAEVGLLFASGVGGQLRQMNESQQQELWQRWLKRYWKNRLNFVPTMLKQGEVARMLEWLPQLPAVFEEAVGLAVDMPPLLQHCSVVRDLTEGKLPARHPAAVARLLIYLGCAQTPHSVWTRGHEIAERLLQAGLPPDLEHKIRELVARLGLG